jgi:predicted Ser/Thr protein kinase
MIGQVIGKYRIVGQLGRGGTGTVYKALDETLNREVAIKILNPDLANAEMLKRFQAEATILARLNHPQIATIFELFRSDTDLLMVMEFVRGETLDKLSTRVGPMLPERAVYIIDRILEALEHAHRAGIVHRDMKPANVMVTSGGGVKIMDFGIARVGGAEHKTATGHLMGTPAYMSPEQVLSHEVDGRADLYSVGVVLYRLLTGTLPFKADSAIAMLQRQIADTPTPLHLHREGLPDWCEPILQRALAKSPADRFQTAEHFREQLAHAIHLMTATDFAKAFTIEEADAVPAIPAGLVGGGFSPVARPPATNPPPVPAPAGRGSDGATVVLRKGRGAWTASTMTLLAASALVLAFIALRRPMTESPAATPTNSSASADLPRVASVNPARSADRQPLDSANAARSVDPLPVASANPGRSAEPQPSGSEEPPVDVDPEPPPVKPRVVAESRPAARKRAGVPQGFFVPVVFVTKSLVVTADGQEERDAQLVLADGKVVVTPDDDTLHPLYSVPYENVISISYSRGRDPLWNSPAGPEPIIRGDGGVLRVFRPERHWISLRTNIKNRFVILRFGDVQVKNVLSALEERIGLIPRLVERKDAK